MEPSLLQLAITVVVGPLPIMILAELLRRRRQSQWWAFLWLVPVVNIVAVIQIVRGRWPKVGGNAGQSES